MKLLSILSQAQLETRINTGVCLFDAICGGALKSASVSVLDGEWILGTNHSVKVIQHYSDLGALVKYNLVTNADSLIETNNLYLCAVSA